jgi:hypothetical protein
MSERYSFGFDQGGPDGDHTVEAIFDRQTGQYISIRVVEDQRARNKQMSEAVEEIMQEDKIRMYVDYVSDLNLKDPEQYFPNPSGIDDQGEAQVVDP